MKLIKIITAVERIPVSSLQGMTRISKTGVRIPTGLSWEQLVIKPRAQLTISDKVEDKNRTWSAKLVFKTCEELSELDMYAYRCRLSNGQYRLIGNDQRPYPVATVAESMPEKVTENQMNEVTVNWQSPYFIPYIIE